MLVDQNERENILRDENSIVVSASAGSGKTTIMVKKIEIELDLIKDHKTIAAITFTVKATEEIKIKAKSVKKSFVALTNDSFIEQEIIRPFIKDAYGESFSDDYIVEYSDQHKFLSFEEGLKQLRSKNILGSFINIKSNFNFQIAKNILELSIAARQYIQSKYKTIFIDEYQDSDLDMHNFFMKLKNDLGLKIFIVGDVKQAIYLWRGARRNIFSLLASENFSCYELITNFRCHKEIQNYANFFHNPSALDLNHDLIVKNVLHCNLNDIVVDFNRLVIQKEINIEEEITIIANYKKDAYQILGLLNNAGYQFVYIPRTPLDDGLPNGHLLKELAKYTKDESYSIYDFFEKVQFDERKQTLIDIKNIIQSLKNSKNWNKEYLIKVVTNLFYYINLSITQEELWKFCISILDRQYEEAFLLKSEKHKIMTVFASKGLEFKQVISFSAYYPIHRNEKSQNHYVCVTRAKEKFIMFINDLNYSENLKALASQKGIMNLNTIIKFV